VGPSSERQDARLDASADVRVPAGGRGGVSRTAERRRDTHRLCHRPSVRLRARARVSRRDRAVEGVRARERLHRAAGIVAEKPPPGSGGALVSRAPRRLRSRERHAARSRRAVQVRSLVLRVHRLSSSGAAVRALLPVLMVAVSLATHYELYHDWQKAIAFCRTLPDVSPPEPVTFHMYWRESHSRF